MHYTGEKTSHTASDSHKDTKENMIPPVPASPDCTTTSPPSPLLFPHLHTQHTTISEQIAARTRFNNNILKLMVTRGVGEQSGVLSPNIFFPALPLSLYPSYNIVRVHLNLSRFNWCKLKLLRFVSFNPNMNGAVSFKNLSNKILSSAKHDTTLLCIR